MVKAKRYGKSGYDTKREANAAEAAHRKRLETAPKVEPGENVSFTELCDARLADLKEYCVHHYYDENDKLIEKLKIEWSGKDTITRHNVKQFLLKIKKDSAWMANKYKKFISAMFNWGITEELVNYNPATNIKKFPVVVEEKYVPPLEDVVKVLNRASKTQRQYLEVIAYTMGRVREVNNLRWKDIHEDYLLLWTRKSRNSNLVSRQIPLTKLLKEVINSIERQGPYVFMSKRTGTKYVDRKRLLPGLCKKAGVQKFTYHCLRHYGASKLAQEGAPLTDIQALLGHSRATTTDIYLRGLSAASRLDSLKKLDFSA
jgi:integrase